VIKARQDKGLSRAKDKNKDSGRDKDGDED
jgi:hypothetical protein